MPWWGWPLVLLAGWLGTVVGVVAVGLARSLAEHVERAAAYDVYVDTEDDDLEERIARLHIVR